MRSVLLALALGALLFSGCSWSKKKGPDQSVKPPPGAVARQPDSGKLIVTPEKGLFGKVALVNAAGRFVVLNFPIGHLPAAEQRLNIYRKGLKVAEVKVTGEHLDDNVVADLVAGDAEMGDDARDQ